MEPNKSEKQFRDKLITREINPSAQAWDRLDAMLTVAEEKKTRRPFGFLFIAASVLVFATLGIFFFTQNDTEIKPSTTIVGTETKQDDLQKEAAKYQEPIIEKTQKNPIAINQFQSSPEARPNSLERSGKNQKTAVNQKTNDNQNQINKDKEIEFMLTGDVAIKDLPRIPNTDGIVIITGKNNSKSDEALLADLDKTAKQSTNQKTVVKVDAKSLLSQADGEVDYTFREKVINRVNKNYQEVKVALANRNKE
jgi:hypothetical protein